MAVTPSVGVNRLVCLSVTLLGRTKVVNCECLQFDGATNVDGELYKVSHYFPRPQT